MKSNLERSNECLPPKKREIPASNLPSVEKPQGTGPASESQRGENLAWLASLASGHDSGKQRTGTPPGNDRSLYKPSTESSLSSSTSLLARAMVTSLSTPYTSTFSQPAPAGAIQYTQLPPNLHFINSSYAAPYTGYISSPLMSPSSTTTLPPRPPSEAYAGAVIAKAEQQQQLVHSPGTVATEVGPQYIHIASSSPLSVSAPHAHLPLHLHSHPALLPQALALGGSQQVLVQYPPQDRPTKKDEGRSRELLNGELEAGQHYGLVPESVVGKQRTGTKAGSSQLSHHHQQQQHYEARQVMIPAEHAQETSGIRTPLMAAPNSHGDPESSSEKQQPSSTVLTSDKGGICSGKPVSRASPFTFPAPQPGTTVATLSPHSVIQTTHNVTEQVSAGIPSTNLYPTAGQPPIIGYIAGGQQQPVAYHSGIASQLVIPGSQPLIIPMTSGDPTHTASATQQLVTAAVAKCEPFDAAGPYHAATVVQAQLHLPVVPGNGGALAVPPLPSSPSLPPYFMKGSIIQLADGELKRVEDLRTEDFLQSAEISGELKIDSSTVERVDNGPTANLATIQFSVGEHRAQVSVEVLVEYPFFVFGKGWSSCCPDRTTQLFELPCSKLSVGDVCISLTLKNLRNGSKKAPILDVVGSNSGLLLMPPKGVGGSE
ncbi:hypothetical protein GJAV_G00099860, partial [Gymnothorax javanicus]